MPEVGTAATQVLLAEEIKKYIEFHPELLERLGRAEKLYEIFGRYLNLTQSRMIIRESGASTIEADQNATLLRTDR